MEATAEMRAACIAGCLGARIVEVWSDKLGFFTCTLPSGARSSQVCKNKD